MVGPFEDSFLVAETHKTVHIATVDDFIDVIMKDHRKYIKWYAHDSDR